MARRTLSATAALVFVSALTLAAAWSATESARAADQVRRSSTTLVQLATLRAAIAEARVNPSMDDTRTKSSPTGRARRAIRTLDRLYPDGTKDLTILDRLEALVRERIALHGNLSPERVALLDDEIERLTLERETLDSARLGEAARRVEASGRQTLLLVATLGIVAAGATAFAFQPPVR